MTRARVGAFAAFGAILGIGVYGLLGGSTPIGTASEVAPWQQGRIDAPACFYSLGQCVAMVYADGGITSILADGGQGGAGFNPTDGYLELAALDAGSALIGSLVVAGSEQLACGATFVLTDGGVIGREICSSGGLSSSYTLDDGGLNAIFIASKPTNGAVAMPELRATIASTNAAQFYFDGAQWISDKPIEAPVIDAGVICLGGVCNTAWPVAASPGVTFSGYLGGTTQTVSATRDVAVWSPQTPIGGFTQAELAWSYQKAGTGTGQTMVVELFKNHATQVSYITGIACDGAPGVSNWTSAFGSLSPTIASGDTVQLRVDASGCGSASGYPDINFTVHLH